VAYQLPAVENSWCLRPILTRVPNEWSGRSFLSPTIARTPLRRYIAGMRFEKVWIEQCNATNAIKRRFGAKSALDYLIGEKLMMFADAAKDDPNFAKELPRFLAAIWQLFNQYEIIGYITSRKPATRRTLRQLLYLR
jgi:hypothetical protein